MTLFFNNKNNKVLKEINQKKHFIIQITKYFIRYKLNNKLGILDSSSNTSLFTINFLKKGNSFIIEKFLYKNKFNNNLNFLWFSKKFKPTFSTFNILNKFYQIISAIILFPIKGGFIIYSFGILGILPYKEILLLDKIIYNKKQNISIFKKIGILKYFIYNIPIFLKSLKIYTLPLKKNYSRNSRKIKTKNFIEFIFRVKQI